MYRNRGSRILTLPFGDLLSLRKLQNFDNCPENVDSFQRFDFYAPHVKSLDIYGIREDPFRVVGWSLLIERTWRKPLLPNLRSLIMKVPEMITRTKFYSSDQLMWTLAFASSSLETYSVWPVGANNFSTITYGAASACLKAVMQHRPNIRQLSLFQDASSSHRLDDENSSILLFVSGAPYYQHLASASTLQHLTGTTAWLQPEPWLVLSRLPQLESITLYLCADEPPHQSQNRLSSQSFRSLRQFSTRGVGPNDILRVLSSSYNIRHVTSLELDFHIYALDPSVDPATWAIEVMFPALTNFLHLCHLSIKPTRSRDPLVVIGTSVLDVLSRLPLKTVHLGGMVCPSSPWPENFTAAWPLVTSLSLPAQPGTAESLFHFATLPNLEHLELKLDLGWSPDVVHPSYSQAPLLTLESSVTDLVYENLWAADGMARYVVTSLQPSAAEADCVMCSWLLSYWPVLDRVVWSCTGVRESTGVCEIPSHAINRNYIRFLNRRLNTLRDLDNANH